MNIKKKTAADYVKMKNNLSAILKKKGMTADDLAQKSGLTPASISMFRNMKGNISLGNLYEIMQVLNVSIGELFGEVPVNYKDVINIKFIDNINQYSTCEELENITTNYGISTELLQKININYNKNLIVTKITNNSMYDLISPTDEIMIDLLDNDFTRDDLYLIKEQNRLEIRVLTYLKDDDVINASMYNKRFVSNQNQNFERQKAKENICGRVVKILKNTN